MTKGLMAKGVKLSSGVVRPGDAVIVQADGCRNSPGTFCGVMSTNGKLAIKVNIHSFSQTTLFLAKTQVERRPDRD
jgi:hypothetical protein